MLLLQQGPLENMSGGYTHHAVLRRTPKGFARCTCWGFSNGAAAPRARTSQRQLAVTSQRDPLHSDGPAASGRIVAAPGAALEPEEGPGQPDRAPQQGVQKPRHPQPKPAGTKGRKTKQQHQQQQAKREHSTSKGAVSAPEDRMDMEQGLGIGTTQQRKGGKQQAPRSSKGDSTLTETETAGTPAAAVEHQKPVAGAAVDEAQAPAPAPAKGGQADSAVASADVATAAGAAAAAEDPSRAAGGQQRSKRESAQRPSGSQAPSERERAAAARAPGAREPSARDAEMEAAASGKGGGAVAAPSKAKKAASGGKSGQPQKKRPAAAAAGPSVASRPSPAPVYVFWDLDNKYPETLDHPAMIDRMRKMLRKYGKVVDVRAYANYQTLNYVPDIWEEALLSGALDDLAPEELRCPLCNAKFTDEAKMARHFQQLHAREHRKRLMHRKEAKKYVQSSRFSRYKTAAAEVLTKKRGYDLAGILKRLGVSVVAVPMGSQKADVRLQQEAVRLLEAEKQKQQVSKKAAEANPAGKEERERDAASPPDMESASTSQSAGGAAASEPASGAPCPPATAAAGATATATAGATAAGGGGGGGGPPAPVLCLVSDDHGFESLLKLFVSEGWRTVVVSNTAFTNAQARLPWLRMSTGI